MYTVVSEFRAGKYTVMEIDKKITETNYNKYLIDGQFYPVVPVYDLPLHIAIESSGGFIGKKVECV